MAEVVLLLLLQLRLARLIPLLPRADRKRNLPTRIARRCILLLLKADRKRSQQLLLVHLTRLLLKVNRRHNLQILPSLHGIRLHLLVQKAIQVLRFLHPVVLLRAAVVQAEAVGIDPNNVAEFHADFRR